MTENVLGFDNAGSKIFGFNVQVSTGSKTHDEKPAPIPMVGPVSKTWSLVLEPFKVLEPVFFLGHGTDNVHGSSN